MEEEGSGPGDASAEDNGAMLVEPDGSGTIADTSVGYTAAPHPSETGASGIGCVNNGSQGQWQWTSRDGEAGTGGDDGGGEDPEVTEDRRGRQDLGGGGTLEGGHELVEQESEGTQKQAHLADVIELASERLGLFEGKRAVKEGDADIVRDGREFRFGELPCQCFREETNAEDSANSAVNEGFVEVGARGREADADIGTEGLVTSGKCGAGRRVCRGDYRSIIQRASEAIASSHRGPGAKDELCSTKNLPSQRKTLESEVGRLSWDVLVSVTEVILPNPGADTTINNRVTDLTNGGH